MGSPPRPPSPPVRSPSPSPQWVALRRCAQCVSRADADLPHGAEFHIALDAPPCLARLAVSPDLIATGGEAPDRCSTSVRAADPSGVLLLSGCPGPRAAASYFLCDAVSSTVRRLPERPGSAAGTVGLVVDPGGADGGHCNFTVAELVPSAASDGGATLHCLSPEPGVWIQKPLSFPDRVRLPWNSADAFSHDGKLWWADLSQGLLSCDPFSGEPELHFVPLPAAVRLAKGDKQRDVGRHRCLNLSGGKLRFVVITAHACVPKIKLWTLADPAAGEWTLDHEARLEDVWDDPSYTTTGLPKKRPALALVHPGNPGVVYFFLQKHLFGVDLRTKAVTECAPHERDEGDEAMSCSSSVLGWELPPPLTTSSSGPPLPGQELRTTSAFDRIANSFYDAYTRVFSDMEFEQLTKIALGYGSTKTKKEENKSKVS